MERRKIENAQGAVEFALVVPIVLLIVFGMLEIGHLIFVYGSVLNASREAARYGAVTGLVNGNPQYQDCTGVTNTATRVKFLANYSASDVDIKFDSGPGTTPINTCSAMTSSQWTQISSGTGTIRIVVTITSQYNLLLPLIPIPSFTMTSTSARTILGSVQVASTIAAPASVGSPPAITGVSPSSGSTSGGTSVTITGTDLTGATLVSFGGSTATGCTVASATLITCNTPAHNAGAVTISVTTPVATGTRASLFTFVSPPTISSISPGSGSSAGGTPVSIFGTNFSNGTVTFGGTSASCSVTTSRIDCTSPAGTGTASIIVTTPGGTASKAFNYITPTPTISSINPNGGSMAGADTVLINGTYLTIGTVKFGANTAACTANSTATQLSCTTPPSANSGSVTVTVTTSGGSATTSFTYNPVAPTFTSLTPSSGPTRGGTTVTLAGTDFIAGATTVTFGGTPGVSCSVGSPTTLTCNTPAKSAGPVLVSLTTPGGTRSIVDAFTYVSLPTLSGINVISGPAAGGTSVTLTGTNLSGGTVYFGTMLASCGNPSTNNTSLTCVTPASLVSGAVDVSITTAGGTATLSKAFTYIPSAPKISGFSPSDGPTAGGSVVTITGTFLSTKQTVTFGGSSTTCTVVSDTELSCITPNHAVGSVSVVVTTLGGTVTAPSQFTYRNAPTISNGNNDILPSSGTIAGGTSVTINGTNFVLGAGGTSVTFGGLLGNCATVTTTQITCTTPAHAAGKVVVVVTTPGGSDTKINGFEYK